MKVRLLEHTPNPEKVIALAGRTCYTKLDLEDLEESLTEEKISQMIKKLGDSHHYSTFEHVTFTFGIEGVSRALTHQLVRHRVASFSQRSQRYVNEKDVFDYTIPETFNREMVNRDNGSLTNGKRLFAERMQIIHEWYKEAVAAGIPAEDARYLLPNATQSMMVVTMNARELIDVFFKKRCCTRAQWEIRELAFLMLEECKKVAPILFQNAGPACVSGPCPEGDMSCKLKK